MKILIVEDNILLGKSLKRGLEELGWTVDLAPNGEEGLYCAETYDYEVILLDWMLPKLSGIDLLSKLRAAKRDVPTIMMTAKETVLDRVEGLNKGADDYLVKPFDFIELVARVNALYRRSLGKGTSALSVGALTLHLASHCASLGGRPLDLTGKEYDLLAALAARPGELVKRNTLTATLYELDGEPESNSLDVLLARIRRKLAGSNVEIATLRGKGFVLRVAKAPA